jgi:quercetin dioxygenase-like cupin family protein
MLTRALRNHKATLVATLAAAVLAAGWLSRELAHAEEKAKLLESRTVTVAEVKMEDAAYEGKPTGQAGIYFQGTTAGTRNFVTGRFSLRPNTEPHPPHRHAEEEVLIVTAGTGEVYCDGKTTKVGPGAVMYTAPNVEHGLKNTGEEPLVFYFVKWIGVGSR